MAKKIDIDFVYGLPPASHLTEQIVATTMPIAEIIPAEPSFNTGMNLFRLDDKWEIYHKLLEAHGFTRKETPIKVAFQADSFPTDSFSNEYGETFLDQFVQATSTGLNDLSQMFGARSATGLGEGLGEAIGDNIIGKSISGGTQKIKDLQQKLKTQAEKKGKNAIANRIVSTASTTADALLAGGRVDFPLVWKNSSFTPSYTMTIRLYNPYPHNDDATEKYIIGPLTALLILGLPRTENDSSTYSWPFFTKVKAPGIYNLQSSYINSISVIKGGDSQSIAYNQRLAIIDVRLDFGSLYGSILIDKKGSNISDRPTLGSYINALRGETDTPDLYAEPSGTSGISTTSSVSADITNSPTGANETKDMSEVPTSRSDSTKLAMSIQLANQGDSGFYN